SFQLNVHAKLSLYWWPSSGWKRSRPKATTWTLLFQPCQAVHKRLSNRSSAHFEQRSSRLRGCLSLAPSSLLQIGCTCDRKIRAFLQPLGRVQCLASKCDVILER